MRGSAALRTGVTPGGALAGPWVRNALWTRARAVPSLDLCFADTKSLVCGTTGQNLVTFTRASSGTFVGSNGVLRNAVTNLLLRSEEFENASWQKNAVTVSANVAINPSGIQTADKIEETAVTNFFSVIQNPTGAFSTTYTWSCYAKASERNFLAINFSISGAIGTWNLTTGVNNITGGTATAVFVGNGWWRLSVTFTTPASGANILYHIFGPCLNNSPINYAGTAGSGIFLWGAQLEQSATVGEYIPTTSAINSAPRFDHNPTTGESLGLLVEEARTNLVTYSEQLNDVIWGPVSGTVTANAETSPASTLTADKLIAANGGPAGQVSQGATITSGATVTVSVYAKAGGFDRLELVLLASNNTTPYGRSTFNPNTGVITTAAFTSNGGTNPSSAVQTLSNGWYRFSVTVTYPAVTSAGMRLLVSNSDAANGDGVKGVFLWGAQLEAGAFPTSYIPTTTATVTRAADVASITGTNFSSWYRQAEGTVFTEYAGRNRVFMADDETTNNRFEVRVSANTSQLSSWSGGTQDVVGIFAPGATGLVDGVVVKTAVGLKVNDAAISTNGSAVGTDTSCAMPVALNRMILGSFQGSGTFLNGPIKRLTYFPTRLSNEVLQRITQP